ncbi:hypothetical protein B0H21DRAFT_708411 [Amylocystis lapponica]|nr:hypothetical protein B0H21DRAFT_708411 [Amylocystis lapponica]
MDSLQLTHGSTEILSNVTIADNDSSRQENFPELIRKAEACLIEGHCKEAYRQAISVVVGGDFIVPLTPTQGGGVKSEVYLRLTIDERINLMICCNGMAKCMQKTDKSEALNWLEEVDILWKHYCFRVASVDGRGCTDPSCLPLCHTRPLRKILYTGEVEDLSQFRHPDPRILTRPSLSPQSLQMAPASSYPAARGALLGSHMMVHDDKAYLFKGKPILDYFDLITERWGQLRTSVVDIRGRRVPWPYTGYSVRNFTMQLVRGQLFVFAGAAPECMLGINLLVALDFRTKKWTLLSGSTREPKADYTRPGPRTSLGSWVNSQQDRIYILYGAADKQAAGFYGQPHGRLLELGDPSEGVAARADDWKRALPSGRNPNSNATVVFGGYNPRMPTDTKRSENPSLSTDYNFSLSFYADTFILDHSVPSAPTWKHILTRGFPTYRAGARLHTDPDTGRTFLFGGYTNTIDLWQLRMDVPGGFFEEVDWDDEEHAVPMGTCRGHVFFCDAECMRNGWHEHKKKHGCAKR